MSEVIGYCVLSVTGVIVYSNVAPLGLNGFVAPIQKDAQLRKVRRDCEEHALKGYFIVELIGGASVRL